VRITAQLVEAATDRHLWAESYERDLRDVLSLQSEVARAVASEIRVKLTPQEQVQLVSARRVNPEAHEAYLQGRYRWNMFSPKFFQKAVEYFEQAIQKDPSYAPAYSGLADCYSQLAGRLFAPAEAMPKAKQAALKALELDPNLAEGHTSLAVVRFYYEWDWSGAESEYKRAIELNPGYPLVHVVYAFYLSAKGKFNESLEEIRKAAALDPLSLGHKCSEARLLYYARRYDQAIEIHRQVVELDPSHAERCYWMPLAYVQNGLLEQAIEQEQKAMAALPDETLPPALLGRAYALAGRKREAQALLNKLLGLSEQRYYISPYNIAVLYTGLNDKDQAFAWLEKAVQARAGLLVYLKVDPVFDILRSDPRFLDLVRRIGLPP
jgi:tetratricopeptide (TPR) repeat protein